MQPHRMDSGKDNDEYTTASNTLSIHQPLLPVCLPSPSTMTNLSPFHYGSCGKDNISPDPPRTPYENDSVVILKSDSENDDDVDITMPPPPPPPPPPSKAMKAILSTYHGISVPLFVVGSVPHSVLVATTIGTACGISAYLYNTILQYGLITIWKTWSQQLLLLWLQRNPEDTTTVDFSTTPLPTWTILWLPIVAIVLSIGLGYTVRYVGEPGDLASTIQCVHLHGWIELNHAVPMTLASLFSIIAGASVGPEAALVAVCATLAGFISQSTFGINPKTQRNLVRKHTLMGVRPFDRIVANFGIAMKSTITHQIANLCISP